MQRVARRWLLLLGAAVLLLAGTMPAATSAGAVAAAHVSGANSLGPDDVRLHSALLPPQVDRGTSPERPAALGLAPVSVSGARDADVTSAAGRAGLVRSVPTGSDAWGRAPPARPAVPDPS